MGHDYENPYLHLAGSLTDATLLKAGFKEKIYDTGEVRLNYLVGPERKKKLLLLPAQMGNWESYRKVLLPLSGYFQIFCLDIRGHGKSSWTPGAYSFAIIGRDLESFIENVVQGPLAVAGNSSGGLLALWCGANLGSRIEGLLLEDAPLFSAEMPRFKERDRFVYRGLEHLVQTMGDVKNKDYGAYFSGVEMPVSENRTKRMPGLFVRHVVSQIRDFQKKYPNRPIEAGYPKALRILIKSLSMFDSDFARAFVDGRFYAGLNHREALAAVSCPLVLLHGDWKRYKRFGLVGAMDGEDAREVLRIAPETLYKRVAANHVIHAFAPEQYMKGVLALKQAMGNRRGSRGSENAFAGTL